MLWHVSFWARTLTNNIATASALALAIPAPVFEMQGGRAVIVGVGVVSWSTEPHNSDGCGGLTGVTPLTVYRDWIVQTAAKFGSSL